ncbi:MAG: hypothetical protein RL088_3375 [Verrucomicrobiota bacterium]
MQQSRRVRSGISDSPEMKEHEPDAFEKAAQQKPPGLVREIVDLLRSNRKWWLVPVLIVLLGVGAVLAFAITSPAAAPFIYSLF